MTNAQKIVENAAIGVAVMDDPNEFGILQKPGVAAAILRRQSPANFQSWINALPPENLPSVRSIVRTEVVRDFMEVICHATHLPYTLNTRYLIDDVAILAEKFSELMDVNLIRIRFDVIDTDACRKFHIDAVTARLVCTYRGVGTQYGISNDGADPKRIFQYQLVRQYY